MTLLEHLQQKIRQSGPITIAEYMSLALHDPQFGYYRTKEPIGKDGDFVTAPEISQMFGELLGVWLVTYWQMIHSPEDAILVELGAGKGTLMSDILRSAKKVPNFLPSREVHIIDINPALIKEQQKALQAYDYKLNWHEDLSSLPDKPALFIANEFFDALPITQCIWREGEWRERLVGLDDHGALTFTHSEQPTLNCRKIPSDFKEAREGDIYEFSEASMHITEQMAAHIKKHGGGALIIDYGYALNKLKDTLQAVKEHRYHDVLDSPGEADITAHVNFPSLQEAAFSKGCKAHIDVTQGELLVDLGIQVRAAMLARGKSAKDREQMMGDVERLISPEHMGILFKCMAITPPNTPAPYGFT